MLHLHTAYKMHNACIKAFTNLSSAEPHNKVMRNMGRFCYWSYFTNKEIEAWPGIRGSYPKCKLKLRACTWIQIFWLWSPWSLVITIFFSPEYNSPSLFFIPTYTILSTWHFLEHFNVRSARSFYNHDGPASLEASQHLTPPTVHSGLTGPWPRSSYRARDAQLRMGTKLLNSLVRCNIEPSVLGR